MDTNGEKRNEIDVHVKNVDEYVKTNTASIGTVN